MARVLITKTSFTAGELDPQLLGRLDLKAQEDGAARLRNVLVQATGGVTRRPGLARVASLPDARRLISFESAYGPVLVALGPVRIDLIRDGVVMAGPGSAWTAQQLGSIAWTRSGDRLLIVHPEVAPRALVETEPGVFALEDWIWETGDEGEITYQPYARFAPGHVALELRDPSTGRSDDDLDAGPVDLVASEPVFDPLHIGTIVRYKGYEVTITSVDPLDLTQATGLLHKDLENGRATREWDEQAFSPLRGWPATLTTCQDRLVIGGSRSLPDWLWLSRTGRHLNFDLGLGEDDRAIAFRLSADELHTICGLHAGRQLQVFTSAGEWIVRGFPLTPDNAQVELQTRVGSWTGRRLRPTEVDGATLFVGASGREVREFLFADSEQAYQAADVALLARHLLASPVDIAFDGRRRLLMILRDDGGIAAAVIDRNSNVIGWSELRAEGRPRGVAIHDGMPWFLVELGGAVSLERFDDRLGVDHARTLTSAAPATTWSGLAHLNGRTAVAISAEGVVTRATVQGGAIVLSQPTREVTVGLAFTHEVEPMPFPVPSGRGVSLDHPYRPVRVSFRLLETRALRADVGDGPRSVLPGSAAEDAFTGDIGLRTLGWRRGLGQPAWRIVQDDPLPATILSVSTEIKVND